MELFILYALISYLFAIGNLIMYKKKVKSYKGGEVIYFILAPLFVPIFIGMNYTEKNY